MRVSIIGVIIIVIIKRNFVNVLIYVNINVNINV